MSGADAIADMKEDMRIPQVLPTIVLIPIDKGN